jgi:hypothetical protein
LISTELSLALRSATQTSDTVGMANKKNRIPKKDDRVTAAGREGVFAVYRVDDTLHSVDLQQLGSDLRLATIPWDSITFLDGQDTSQASARIVRQATEEK